MYELRVRLPEHYDDSDPARYPVLYLLDGDFAFALATGILGYLVHGGEVPEMILVAIAYGSVKLPEEGGKNMRVRDLTPFPAEHRPGSGGAEQFRQFVEGQVFPFVESTYRTAPCNRALWGGSLGGLFGLYVLFSTPEMFQRYAVISPALQYGSGDVFDLERTYAETHRDLAAKLFLGVGECEYYYPPFRKFVPILTDRHYPSLEMQAQVFQGGTHFGVVAEGLARGLKAVFGKKSLMKQMLTAIRTEGIESALNLYRDLRQNEFDNYDLGESELNSVGQYLLASDQVGDAIQVFKQNLVIYPAAYKTWEGLAQAYRMSGDGNLAVECLEKAEWHKNHR